MERGRTKCSHLRRGAASWEENCGDGVCAGEEGVIVAPTPMLKRVRQEHSLIASPCPRAEVIWCGSERALIPWVCPPFSRARNAAPACPALPSPALPCPACPRPSSAPAVPERDSSFPSVQGFRARQRQPVLPGTARSAAVLAVI